MWTNNPVGTVTIKPSIQDGQQEAIHNTNIKRAITSGFARALKVLQQKHLQCSEEEFVYSNDASNNLCNSLEAAFLHGLKDSVAHKLTAYIGLTATTDQSATMNFWSVIAKFIHSDVVTQIQQLTQITTEIGLCRAWVRLALNDGLMESYLHSMIVDTKTLKYFYHSHSYLRDHEQPGILKNYLTGLMSLEFKLSYNSSVLNRWNNSTLQLIGVMDTHFAPSPAIGQTMRGPTGLVSAHQKNSQEIGEKIDDPNMSPKHAESISRGGIPAMSASMQEVVDLCKESAATSDRNSCLSLSASEGSSSSHVSCPDPDVGAANEAKLYSLEISSRDRVVVSPSQAGIDNLPENVSIPFANLQEQPREQGSLDGTSNHRAEVLPLHDAVESDQKSHVIIEEADPLVFTTSPSLPQSRRVDEEDIHHIFSSSSSPPFSQWRSSETHSATVPSEENLNIVHSESSSPHRNNLLHLETVQNSLISQETSTGFNQTVGEEQLMFRSQQQDTQQTQSSEGDDNKSRTNVLGEIYATASPGTLENEVVLRKKQKDENSRAYKDRQREGNPSDSSGDKSSDFKTSGSAEMTVNDISSQESSEQQHRHYALPESVASFIYSTESGKSPALLATKDAQSVLIVAAEERGATPRKRRDVHASDVLKIDKKNAQGHKQSHDSAFSHVTKSEHDSAFSHVTKSEHDSAFSHVTKSEQDSAFSHVTKTEQDSAFSHVTKSEHDSAFEHATKSEHDSQITELAEEATNKVLGSNDLLREDKHAEIIEAEVELSISPSRFGNSLNSMSGWSSEIESKGDMRKHPGVDRNRAESFASMLHTYTPALSQPSPGVTLDEVIEALPCETEGDSSDGDRRSGDVSPTRSAEDIQWEELGLENFEVLKSPSEFFCGQVEANSSRMYFLFHVPREHGLSHQNFSCKGCFRPIGIIYGPPRLCEFDGGLYCYGCHENNEAYIPSSILYDWDFRKKKVCQENYKFLQDLEEQALYDVEELNPKLYSHVPELHDLLLLRQQLCYLKSYLFTCSQKVAESLRQRVWPREHLYDRRDLYSIVDFLQVQSGSLQRLIKDLVKFSSQHVYDCAMCSLKGFVCEICRKPQVIYPFEVDTTIRCKTCKAVYHKTCMTESLPCPKCERWGRHVSTSNTDDGHPEDYGMSPHT